MSLLVLAPVCLLSCGDDPARPPATGGTASGEDMTPPAAVKDLSITYDPSTETAELTWSAPRDPGASPRVARYEIRYSYSLPLNMDIALRIDDPPIPGVPGHVESVEIANPQRGRDLYAVVRSYDDAGNPSPVSGIAHRYVDGHQFSGQCIDAWSGLPLSGLDATVTSRRVTRLATDAAGRFQLDSVAGGAVNVSIRGTGATVFHTINHAFEMNDDVSILYKMIEYHPTDLSFDSILQTFLVAINFNATGPIFRKWRTVPVPVYIPTYTSSLGTNYDSLAVAAVEYWETSTGVDLFELVDSIPEVGVEMRFLPQSAMGIYNGRTERTNDSNNYPFHDTVKIVNSYAPTSNLFLVFVHELGHTIRLEHLPHPRYIMYASTLPSKISDDEVLVVQLHAALPNSINLSIYDPSVPSQ